MKTHISRKLLSVSAFACLLALPAVAAAQAPQPAPAPAPAPAAGAGNAGCAPGSWFCGDAQATGGASTGAAAGASGGGQLQPLPGAQPAAQPGVVYHDAPAPPPVVVYQPAPPVVIVQGRAEAPPPYVYTPRKPLKRREWGLNLRLEGAMFGHGAHDDSGMGGGGLGVRFKPVPFFGVEAGLDFLGGRDYNGFRRGETAFTVNSLFFVNPKSKAQLYFDLGFGWSGAHAVDDRSASQDIEHSYSYFGGQAGVGMEFRLAKHFALNLELLGFVRGRTDDSARVDPEFVDSNGRTSNTSGGGLLRGGMTFYF